ncbi:hypothetical protein, partial [Serratia marcescens]|uniref:hypothetical protein n=1 Tax=Serratia marcescens TaxID=615 RepID=UPI00281697B5
YTPTAKAKRIIINTLPLTPAEESSPFEDGTSRNSERSNPRCPCDKNQVLLQAGFGLKTFSKKDRRIPKISRRRIKLLSKLSISR